MSTSTLAQSLMTNLTLCPNTNAINKKCASRIYLLQKLRNLDVNKDVLQLFYRFFIETLLTFSFLCWYGSLDLKRKNVLQRVVNVCSKVAGVRQESMGVLYERRATEKARKIACDSGHVLAKNFYLLPSGNRYRVPKTHYKRTKDSFIPTAIIFLNNRKRGVRERF